MAVTIRVSSRTIKLTDSDPLCSREYTDTKVSGLMTYLMEKEEQCIRMAVRILANSSITRSTGKEYFTNLTVPFTMEAL